MYSSMAQSKFGTLVNTPQRNRLSVIPRENRATMLSHEAEVGVKCICKRGCLCVA